MRVVVQGRLKQRSYETREGEKRTVYELDVEEVGPSLKYATAKVTRTQRSGGGGGFSGGGGGARAAARAATTRGRRRLPSSPPPRAASSTAVSRAAATPAPNDPWGAPGVSSEEPPF